MFWGQDFRHHDRWREKSPQTLTSFPAPVVYNIPRPMEEGFCTLALRLNISAVNVSKRSVPPLYKNQSPSALTCVSGKWPAGIIHHMMRNFSGTNIALPKAENFGRGQVTDLGVTVLHFSGPMNRAIFLGIVPLNFRENQGKDTICKIAGLKIAKPDQ